MADSAQPLEFGVNEGETYPADSEEMGQFADLICKAELASTEENEIFRFMDEDGEDAFFRANDVAMIQIPLWVVEPDLIVIEDPELKQAAPEGHA